MKSNFKGTFMDKPEKTIDHWFTISDGVISRLMGDSEGRFVRTSTIIGKHGDKIVTRNTVYTLLNEGSAYPNTKQILLDSLDEVGIEVVFE